VNHGYDDYLWHEFSKAFGFIPQMIPLLPVPGNHDKAREDKGPVYAVSVSGPKMYSQNDKFSHLMKVETGNTRLYQVITLNPKQLHYQSWSLDHHLIDEFKLKQNPKGTTLVEMK
jgi:hypothetical protein